MWPPVGQRGKVILLAGRLIDDAGRIVRFSAARRCALRSLLLCLGTAASVAVGLLTAGCATVPWITEPDPPPIANPIYTSVTSFEGAWESTVDVLHQYGFRIPPGGENRLEYVIETEPMIGSGILEPWFGDSVGKTNRLESTLQSIRRRVLVRVQPHETGGHLVGVEVIKEREDVAGLAANSPGGASLQEYDNADRDLRPVLGQTGPSVWYPIGRDFALEQRLLASLQETLVR